MAKYLKALLAETQEDAALVYEEYAPLLRSVANSYSKATGLDVNDLFSEAILGLATAAREFDPERSSNFKDFALVKVRDSLHNYIRKFSSVVSIPSYVKKTSSLLTRLQNCLMAHDVPQDHITTLLYYGIDSELFSEYNCCKDIFDKLVAAAERARISYTELVQRSYMLPTNMEITETCAVHEIDDPLLIVDIRQYLDSDEYLVVKGVMEGKSYEEIGAEVGKSHNWAYRKMEKIRTKLKAWQ